MVYVKIISAVNYHLFLRLLHQTIMQAGRIKSDPYDRVIPENNLILRLPLFGRSTSVKPHQNRGPPTKLTPIPSNYKHHGRRCTCASMTLPYWPKVRSSVRSVVSHDSPPTKIRPTLSSAILGPSQLELPARQTRR